MSGRTWTWTAFPVDTAPGLEVSRARYVPRLGAGGKRDEVVMDPLFILRVT